MNAIKNYLFLMAILVHSFSGAMFNDLPVVLSNTQTKLATAIAPMLVCAGGLFLAQKSNIAEDPRFLRTLGITASVAGGGTYALSKKFTCQAQLQKCECIIGQLNKDIVFKKEKGELLLTKMLMDNVDTAQVIRYFNDNIEGQDVVVGSRVLKHLVCLANQIESVQKILPLIHKKMSGESLEYNFSESLNDDPKIIKKYTETLSEQLTGYGKLIKKIRGVFRNSYSNSIMILKAEKIELKKQQCTNDYWLGFIARIFAIPAISTIILQLFTMILEKSEQS
jgi:hypothetical protein